jgi:hypothetical protein
LEAQRIRTLGHIKVRRPAQLRQAEPGEETPRQIALVYNRNVIYVIIIVFIDHLCGLVVRVPGYGTEMYCVSCEVRTEFIYVM